MNTYVTLEERNEILRFYNLREFKDNSQYITLLKKELVIIILINSKLEIVNF